VAKDHYDPEAWKAWPRAVTPCTVCNGQGLTGWEKPMGFPPRMVFVPQFCQCEKGRDLARINAPDAKRTIISSIPGFEE
jgi:hypothetical protein